jgi:hypothetical protein
VFFLAFLVRLASAETLYTASPVTAARWPDSDRPVAFPLEAGDRVEVLARQGDKVRVSKGPDFGWVLASALTDKAPMPDLPLDVDADPPPEAPAAAAPAAEAPTKEAEAPSDKPAGKSGKKSSAKKGRKDGAGKP